MSFYVVPMEGTGTKTDPRREKYIPALEVDRALVDHDDSAIVWANTTPQQEADLKLNADLTLIPPLDNAIALNATVNMLEANHIPAQWVNAGMTYRTVLRVVVGMAQLIQRTEGLGAPIHMAGNLDKTVSQLAANVRQAFMDASDSLGLDRSSITGATTIRVALHTLGQQFADGRGVRLGDL